MAGKAVDFTSLDLFAITGATGARKTSLLDAITFALYDKVANKPNSSKELVSQGATQLKVELRFEMRQTEYRLLRTWRNRGKTDEKKFLFDQLIDGEWERCDRTGKSCVLIANSLRRGDRLFEFHIFFPYIYSQRS